MVLIISLIFNNQNTIWNLPIIYFDYNNNQQVDSENKTYVTNFEPTLNVFEMTKFITHDMLFEKEFEWCDDCIAFFNKKEDEQTINGFD